jgi:hypothetical protein
VAPRRASIVVAVAAFALGAACFGYGLTALPLRGVIRGHLGDVAAAAFVHGVLGLALRGPATRAGITAALALAVELAQLRGDPGAGAVGELALGAHFDPLDLVMYALGIAAALVGERRLLRPGRGR